MRRWFLRLVLNELAAIRKELESIMAGQAELDSALAAVEASVQKLGSDMEQAIKDLEAKIGNAPDLAPEVQRLNDLATKLQGFDAEAVAADPGAPPPP